jgi:hypothetical protein
VLMLVHDLDVALSAAIRGAVNTPEAMREARKGKEWDGKTRKWVVKPTNTLVEDSPTFAEARRRHHGTSASSSKSATAFPHYYSVLGVEARSQSCLQM